MYSEYKPKRYIIEMFNDFIRDSETEGNAERVNRLNKARNAYISADITKTDAIKIIMEELRKIDLN